jgi:hypothetical protein
MNGKLARATRRCVDHWIRMGKVPEEHRRMAYKHLKNQIKSLSTQDVETFRYEFPDPHVFEAYNIDALRKYTRS